MISAVCVLSVGRLDVLCVGVCGSVFAFQLPGVTTIGLLHASTHAKDCISYELAMVWCAYKTDKRERRERE